MDLEVQLGNNPKFCSLLSVRLKQNLSGVNLLKCTEKYFLDSFLCVIETQKPKN